MELSQWITRFANEFWYLFNEMALYLIIGFFFAGVLHFYFPKKWIIKRMGRSRLMSNVWASLFGIPLPLCSCGVVPTGIALRKSGASKGSTVSFLTATPQTGVDSILVTYSFFGWTLSIFKVFAALVSGVVGGVLVDLFDGESNRKPSGLQNEKELEKQVQQEGLREKSWKAFVEYVFRDQPLSLRKWLLIGLVLATLISMLIPKDLAQSLNLNDNLFLSYFIFLALGIPMYICSTGSVPMAAALLAKGFPAGGVFVFLMAGPATNAASIALLYKTLGKKSLWIYVGSIVFCSLFFGWAFDTFFPGISTTLQERLSNQSHHHDHGTSMMAYLQYTASGAMLLFLSQDYLRKGLQLFQGNSDNLQSISIEVEGMTCGKCLVRAQGALQESDGVERVDLSFNGQGTVQFQRAMPAKELKEKQALALEKVKAAGYKLIFKS